MEKVLFKSGLHMTNRVLSLFTHLQKKNIDIRLEALLQQTGLAIGYTSNILDSDWEIVDAGGGSIQVKAGIAVFSDYEAAELDADSDSIAITDDSAVYTVLITRADYEKEVGTVAITTGSLTIAGTSTLFDDEFEVGERFMIDATNAANQVPLIIASIASNVSMTVEAIDGNGDPVALVNEATLDFWSVGRFANGYPSGGDDENLRNHDQITIVVTLAPGGYSPSIVLGTVARTGAALTIVDQREASLLQSKTYYPNIFSSEVNMLDTPAPDKYGGGIVFAISQTNGLTVVKVDDSIDWRDRLVVAVGFLSYSQVDPSIYKPPAAGTVLFSSISVDGDGALEAAPSQHFVSGMIYTKNGSAAGSDAFVFKNDAAANPGDQVRLWADDGTSFDAGDLVMVKDANTANQHVIALALLYSPKQNHF